MHRVKTCSVRWADVVQRSSGPSKLNAVLKLLLAVEGAEGMDGDLI